MTYGEQLVIYSSLPGQATASAHFLAIDFGTGGGDTILGDCFYKVAYVGDEVKDIEYRLPNRVSLAYKEAEPLVMSLLDTKTIKISYIETETIKLEFKC